MWFTIQALALYPGLFEIGQNYAVGSTTNLVDEPATNPTVEAGSVAIDSRFESVTNRVSTDAENEQFLQLRVHGAGRCSGKAAISVRKGFGGSLFDGL